MTYKHIERSIYVYCSIPKEEHDRDEKCLCHRSQQPNCGKKCLNRISKIECNRFNCLCKEYCTNRYFGKESGLKLDIVEAPGKGEGLVALEPINKGTFIVEYVGEVYDLTTDYGAKRYQRNQNQGVLYMMELSKRVVVDASMQGNLSRFINHSCQPNCEVEKWLVNGQPRLGIFAIRNISQFQQLSYNYQKSFWQQDFFTCRCGTPSCHFKQIPSDTITLQTKIKVGHLMYLKANYFKYPKQESSTITWDKTLLDQNIQNLDFQLTLTIFGPIVQVHNDRNMITRLSKIQLLKYFFTQQTIHKIEYYLNISQIFYVSTKEHIIYIMGLSSQLKDIKRFLSQSKDMNECYFFSLHKTQNEQQQETDNLSCQVFEAKKNLTLIT